jgi:alpha-L-fucosidase
MKHIVLITGLFLSLNLFSQTESETYVWPVDPLVKANLSKWQDQKFGIMISWGLYSQKGILESWGLCPEDADWIGRNGYKDYSEYATDYRNTRFQFNPLNFDPQKWAKTMKAGGAKYMIFITKHHDGFCMFDSKFTDFKITSREVPFSVNPKANIAGEIFNAFRNEGLSVGAYFSKPDWSNPGFWWPYFPPKDRNPNYDITKHPDQWKKYVDYTQNQLNELVSDYGKLDILWLDGCWVRPLNTINKHVEEFCKYPYDMDIDMKSITANARAKQPGILVVDRWVPGPYEDYLTPEQKTPEKALPVPWESCITLGTNWGWTPSENYKSTRDMIHLLVNIVSKGGNLLLGIGPDGKGDFAPEVYDRISGIGKWLEANGDAIYGTRPVEPFQEGSVCYTSKGNTIYVIYLVDKDEKIFSSEIRVKTDLKGKLKIFLPLLQKTLKYKQEDGEIVISIPEKERKRLAEEFAVVIKISE